MSNTGYNSGYLIYPTQRLPRNPVISTGPLPPNQRSQILLNASNHSSSSSLPAARFREGPLHSSSSPVFSPVPPPHPSGPATRSYPHMLPQYPTTPHFAPYPPMDAYAMSRGDSFVTAAELQMEPSAYFTEHGNISPFLAEPMEYRPSEQMFNQFQDGRFNQRLSSPSDHGSPREIGSPSVAGSAITEKAADQPYAKLIFEALKAAPNHSMILKDIYRWFELNTDKPQRAPVGKQGWKNSIRHNLSMNKGFEKVAPPTSGSDREANKGCIWRLTKKALDEDCIMSTTRYRQKTSNKRCQSSDLLHQRQGDGGRVLKRSPPREVESPRLDQLFSQAMFDDLQTQQQMSVEMPYEPMGYYPYSSAPALSSATFAPQTSFASSFPPFSAESSVMDSSMTGGSFGLYDPALPGTPVSTSSTQDSSILADFPSSQPSTSRVEQYEVEGVSNQASKFDLFAAPDSPADEMNMQLIGSTGELPMMASTSIADMSALSMADDLSEWPLDTFGSADNDDQPRFLARL